jgi:uncharacterized membrane protein
VEAAIAEGAGVDSAAEVEGALAEAGEVPRAAAREGAGNSFCTMKVRHFLSKLEHDHVHRAIRLAEAGTSGDIVLYISRGQTENPLAAANREFRKLKLDRAREQNSFLIFLAPKSQKFAVVGGTALHEKVGQAWWDELAALLTRHFREHCYTDGLVAAIEQAGQALKTHFPATGTNRAGQRDIVEK